MGIDWGFWKGFWVMGGMELGNGGGDDGKGRIPVGVLGLIMEGSELMMRDKGGDGWMGWECRSACYVMLWMREMGIEKDGGRPWCSNEPKNSQGINSVTR